MNEKEHMILVVDDDEGVRDSLITILEDEYDVWAVESGKRALEFFLQLKPDLVFLDMILPDVGGIQVLKRMKTIRPVTPIIIFTAYSTMSDALYAIKCGASDYIPKPFGVNEIRRSASDLLSRKTPQTLDGELFRRRWSAWKRHVRERFLTTAFIPGS